MDLCNQASLSGRSSVVRRKDLEVGHNTETGIAGW